MPLISVAMHEDHNVGKKSVVIYDVTIKPSRIMVHVFVM